MRESAHFIVTHLPQVVYKSRRSSETRGWNLNSVSNSNISAKRGVTIIFLQSETRRAAERQM